MNKRLHFTLLIVLAIFINVLGQTVIYAQNNALNFDGTNDVVNCGNNANLKVSTGTIEAWVKSSGGGSSWRGIIIKQFAYGLFLKDNILVTHDWSVGLDRSTGVNLADNQWHHVAMSFQLGVANGTKIYIDGNLALTTVIALNSQNEPLLIGGGGIGIGQIINGSIDAVRIWGVVRTQAEIQASKYAELSSGTGLISAYHFNQGTANGTNTGITTLNDVGGSNNGTLQNFALTGTTSNWVSGFAVPEINLQGNGTTIADGDNTPSLSEHTDFGAVSNALTRTFTIQNTGTGTLNMTSITSSNTRFVVSSAPTSVAAGSSATFNVTFTPTNNLTQTATIIINNNDSDEGIYDFVVSGSCSPPAVSLATTNDNCLISNNLTLSGASSAAQIQWQLNGATVSTVSQTYATTGVIVAGGNGVGSAANQLYTPTGIGFDGNGNMYIGDFRNNRIQKWAVGATTGVTVAGGNGAGGAANQFDGLRGIYVDAVGNVYVADANNHRVQKWAVGATTGVTVAGGNGLGAAANQLNQPFDVFVDASGNIFIADAQNRRIQKWAAGASSGTTVAGGNGTGSAANQLGDPQGVYVDGSGNIYVSDQSNNRIQKWAAGASSGTTVAGGSLGTGANQLTYPAGVFVDGLGNIFVCDQGNHRIQKWAVGASTGVTVAGGNGSGSAANAVSSPPFTYVDANGNIYAVDYNNSRVSKWAASLNTTYTPSLSGTYTAIATTSYGCSSTSNAVIINPNVAPSVSIAQTSGTNPNCSGTNVIFTATPTNGGTSPSFQWKKDGINVGTNSATYTDDGTTSGVISCLMTVGTDICPTTTTATSSSINLINNTPLNPTLATTNGNCIGSNNLSVSGVSSASQIQWKQNGTTVSTVGLAYASSGTTVAGTGIVGSTTNQLNYPTAIYVDGSGNIYVADCNNHRIQKWAAGSNTGVTVAGGNGQGSAANQLNRPYSVYVDGSGNIYIADFDNHRIQKWAAGSNTGVTIAGGNGQGSAANQLNNPTDFYVDGSGNIYIADYRNHRVQKWVVGASTGVTVAGGNGLGSAANQLNFPYRIIVDGSGNIYVSDRDNHRIQKWAVGASTGVTVAGGNGAGSAANQFNLPNGIYVDGSGNIYVGDQYNHRVQKWSVGTSTGVTVAGVNGRGSAANQLDNPLNAYIDNSGNIYVADTDNHRVQKWATTGISTTYTPSVSGTYTVIATALNGCSYTSNSVIINPNVTPSVSIALTSGLNPTCSGTNVTFTATATNGGTNPSFQWKKDFNNVGTNSTTYTDAGSTLGFITCVMTVGTGVCTATTTANSAGGIFLSITSSAPPSVSIAANNTTIYSGTAVTFTPTPTNGGAAPTYQWKKNGINVATTNTYTTSDLVNGDVITCDMTSNSPCVLVTMATSNSITMSVISPQTQCVKSLDAGFSYTLVVKQDGTLWAWGNNTYGQLGDGTTTNKNVPTQIGTATNWKTVSTGSYHAVAIKEDGTLWAWGYNVSGQLGDGSTTNRTAPIQIGTATNWRTITAGLNHSIAIKQDGTLWAWGKNLHGTLGDNTVVDKTAPTQIGSATNWLSVSAGSDHSIAIQQDGTLWAWGSNRNGRLGGASSNTALDGTPMNTVPFKIGAATNWQSLSAGGGQSYALKQDGTLWAWGDNSLGQLGDGTTGDKSVPTQIGTATIWQSVNGGDTHALATQHNGTLWAWGYGYYGQIGDGSSNQRTIPTQVGTATTWQNVAAGGYNSLAIQQNCAVWTWGDNASGQIGDATTRAKYLPTQPCWSLSATSLVIAANATTLTTGTAVVFTPTPTNSGISPTYQWKVNGTTVAATNTFSTSNLVDGDIISCVMTSSAFCTLPVTSNSIPITISNPITQCLTAIDAGTWHTLAVKQDGTLWAWGNNGAGQLGDATTTNRRTPTQIGTATNWQNINAGYNHSLGLKQDGTLWAWGANSSGQLGDGTTVDKSVPTQISTATNWQNINAGSGHSLAIKQNGTLWAWGSNFSGQIGDGTTTNKTSPTQIGSATNWKAVNTGTYHSLAVKQDGTLWAWGDNGSGQIGDGSTTLRTSPTQIGSATNWQSVGSGSLSSYAIKQDGTLWAWGDNGSGQLGDGTTTQRTSPIQIGTATNWKSLSGGESHILALKQDGTLWAWGSNSWQQLGNGLISNSAVPIQITTATNWQNVAAGGAYSVAFKGNCTLWSWGKNDYGQIGDGTFANKSLHTQPCWVLAQPTIIIAPSLSAICSGSSVTFIPTFTYGGTNPPYSWRKNGAEVATSNTFTTSVLANSDVISCVMTSNAACLSTPTATSNSVTMSVTNTVTPSVSIAASATKICPNTSVTFTLMPTNGGTSPTYIWKKNGTQVSTDNIYTTTDLANNDVITCEMTSNATCLSTSTATSNSITLTVNPIIDCMLSLSAKAFIQGPYNTNTGLMNDGLRSNGKIPTNQPYNTMIFNGSTAYAGSETVAQSVLDVTGNNAIVDWVLIELRDAASPSTVPANGRRAALLQRDGDIVDVNGTSAVISPNLASGTYHVIIRHRLCLATRTRTAVNFSFGSSTSVDFTNNSNALLGSQKLLTTGVYGLHIGDTDRSGVIASGDVSSTRSRNPTIPTTFIYNLGYDFDFNTSIFSTDVIIVRSNSTMYQVNLNQ